MEIVPEKISFPEAEEQIQSLWDKLDAFQTSVKLSEGKPEYTFYDGPPFATGLPHYGHILAGTIKDTVTRYASQTGHHVVRRFGWDCHGLPIEFEIDKQLGIKTKAQVLELGIPKYNAACRSIVMRYSGEWETVVKRLGRWIDFKNDYKTLDPTFMESVWWVFKQLYEKKLVYRNFKVMPYSIGCTTPLSNFEAGMNYKEVNDPSLVVSFPLISEPTVNLLAWTTTPWTLPSNLALCVNPNFVYFKLQDKKSNKIYILAEPRLSILYANESEYTVLHKYKGKELEGLEYVPLFNYFESAKERGAFKVVCDEYVTSDAGTGVVHQAPAFGEDDHRVCLHYNIISKYDASTLPCPLDENGFFTAACLDLKGKLLTEANKIIRKMILEKERLIVDSTLTHSYPFCWRSEAPLIYRAVPSWFVAVETIKDKLIENNKQTYWVPEHVKEKRFLNWLKDARDWAISRNRYWGTPIPIWANSDYSEIVCIGSIEELEKLSGAKITDLHRESIDHLVIPSSKGGEPLKRVEEVFDCWFESGSMPYAQQHYPFEHKDNFEKSFPADFIAEGIDQTRGWFYTLLVLSTALFDKPPFKNLIVNGLVLAADGKKMSKRLKNYPDPVKVVDAYGADSLRLYLINSPVVRGEDLRFQEQGVKDVIKDLFLPWFNAYRFFVECARRLDQEGLEAFSPNPALLSTCHNVMDQWILAATQSLVKFVGVEMAAYRLYTVLPRLVKFIDQLTNWYVRFNRRRLKGELGMDERLVSLNVLFEVLYTLIRTMSPFTPFFTEYVYQNLRNILPAAERMDSVHYTSFPQHKEALINERIEEAVARMQVVIELGRAARDRKKKPLKYPLKQLTVVHDDPQFVADLQGLKHYILEELNVRELIVASDKAGFVGLKVVPDNDKLGPRLKKDKVKVIEAAKALTEAQIRQFQQDKKIELVGHVISLEEVSIVNEYTGDSTKNEAAWDNSVLIVLNLEVDDAMLNEGYAREIVNRVQKLRKKVHLAVSDPIEVFYEGLGKNSKKFDELVSATRGFVENATRTCFLPHTALPRHRLVLGQAEDEVAEFKFRIIIISKGVALDSIGIAKKYPNLVNDIEACLSVCDPTRLKKKLEESEVAEFTINETSVKLKLGVDVFLSTEDKVKHLSK